MSPPKAKLVVSSRGQITLPVEVRRRLGIKDGGMVTLEEHGGELVLRPAAVLEIEMYSDEDIARWDEEDRLNRAENERLKKKLSRKH